VSQVDRRSSRGLFVLSNVNLENYLGRLLGRYKSQFLRLISLSFVVLCVSMLVLISVGHFRAISSFCAIL